MSMDNNNVVVNSSMGGDVGFHESPYRPRDYGMSPPIMDASRSAGMTPQIMVLLLTHAIKRCWKWALFVGLILSSIAAAATYILYPLKYESTSWTYVSQAIPYTLFKPEGGREEYKGFMQTQFATIRSSVILADALKDPRVAQIETLNKEKDREAYLRKNLSISPNGSSEYFTISYMDKNAADAQAVVDAVTKSYMTYQNRHSTDRNLELRKKLAEEKNSYEGQVRQKHNEILGYLREIAQTGLEVHGDSSTNASLVNATQDSILRELHINQAKLASYEAQLKVAEKEYEAALNGDINDENNPHMIPEYVLEGAIRSDSSVAELDRKIYELKEKIATRTMNLTNPATDRQLKIDNDKLSALEEEKKELEKTLLVSKREELTKNYLMDIQKDIAARRNEIRGLVGYTKELEAKVETQKKHSQERVVDTHEIEYKKAELARLSNTLDKFSDRLAALDTENRAASRIVAFIPANLPLEPKSATRLPLMIMVAAGMFVAPFFLGIVIEMSKPRLYHVSQVRKAVPNIIIGEIMEPPVSWLRGSAFRRRLARYRESVHNWCTHLLLADPFRNCQTLAVASVSEDDGKTFLAIQVASAMAQMKSGPVLLIDGDMRVGRLHLLFGNEESGPGLADVLAFRKGIGEAVVLNEREPNLHLLSAGQLDMSPYELLGDGRFRELLDTLSTHYALILVVVPPVAHAAESLMMAASVDSVILCVRQGATILAAMEDAFRKLVNTGSHVDGVVVKDIPYSQMAGKDGGFSDKVEQIRLSHLLKHSDAY